MTAPSDHRLRRPNRPSNSNGSNSNVSASANPFATRFVSPGNIPYFFASPDDSQQLIAQADRAHWRGQIVGPHGSGKTTLARHLMPELQTRFDRIEFLVVRSVSEIQHCPAPRNSITGLDSNRPAATGKSVYVIDGVGRLSWLQRRLIVADCRRRQAGLIVTSHRRLKGLSVLFETSFSSMTFCKVLQHLDCQRYADRYPQLQSQHRSNCREMLFTLYDQHASEPSTPYSVEVEKVAFGHQAT